MPVGGGNADTQFGIQETTWLGSITSILVRTLFDTKLSVNNLVVTFVGAAFTSTLTCQSICIQTASSAWRKGLAVCINSVVFSSFAVTMSRLHPLVCWGCLNTIGALHRFQGYNMTTSVLSLWQDLQSKKRQPATQPYSLSCMSVLTTTYLYANSRKINVAG